MEEKVDSSHHPPNKPLGEFESLPSVGQIIAKKKIRPPSPAPRESAPPAQRSARPITYPFVPFPAELASLEKRQVLRPAQFRILALRRFAHPVTGEWLTSSAEIAGLIRSDRSTVQKSLRELEHAHFIHVRQLRSRTVQLLINFGGFAQPKHRLEGLAPLRWDAEFIVEDAAPAHRSSQFEGSRHSANGLENGSTEPHYELEPEARGTLPRTKNIKDKSIRSSNNNSELSTATPVEKSGLIPVFDFQPQTHDESVVQELARRMGEKYMNSFLSLRRQYGLIRLEKACAHAQDKLLNPKNPYRKSPGAFVRWLLTTGIC
jgi:hypothetical protein